MLNRKELIEYFEVINNRKPLFRSASRPFKMVNLLWKEDKIILTNNGKTMTEEAMPLSNQMSGQMVNHPSAK